MSMWETIGGVITALIAVTALAVSLIRLDAAHEANLVAASNAWVSIALKHVEEELKNIHLDALAFRQLLLREFAIPGEKRKCFDEMSQLREESARRVYVLSCLVGDSSSIERLTQLRARVELIDDDFFHDDTPTINQDRAREVEEKYSLAFRDYVSELRSFGVKYSIDRGALGVRTPLRRIWINFLDEANQQ